MKKMQLNREAYLKPEVEVIGVNVENLRVSPKTQLQAYPLKCIIS